MGEGRLATVEGQTAALLHCSSLTATGDGSSTALTATVDGSFTALTPTGDGSSTAPPLPRGGRNLHCSPLPTSSRIERRKMNDLEAKATQSWKKKSKKKAKSDLNDSTRVKHANTAGEMQELDAEPDINEPTMAEKLASLDLLSDGKAKNISEKEAPPTMNIPRADSVHVLLKQALNAQDHALLLDCLYNKDEKIIRKSTALLRPSDVLNLLKSLLSMIELRGAVIICALPWLRSVLSQHASSIASQESSLLLLNSLYQLIESRTSTFRSALELSTCLDCLLAGIPEAQADGESATPVVIYEDNDSEEEQEEEYDETNEGDAESEGLGAVIDSAYNSDGSDVMSD